MKAAVYKRKGSPVKLIYSDVAKPEPNDNEVLVRVHAVSLNAADYRSMKMGLIPKRKIFGADIAGHVESVGKNIVGFKPGDEVIGELAGVGFGGLAEYVAVPEKVLIIKPANVSFEDAATIPIAALTALQALRDKGNIQKGHKVLIVGCAGGVGTFSIQVAKYFGAEVTGVCSSRNVTQSSDLGADHVIDYNQEDLFRRGNRYEIVLGINGNYPLITYFKILANQGIYVMIGGAMPQIIKSMLFGWLMSLGSRKMKFVSAKPYKKDMEFLAGLMEKGIIKPVIERRYPLELAAEAMNYISQGHASGKVVVQIS